MVHHAVKEAKIKRCIGECINEPLPEEAQVFWQKAEIEKNHEFIRYVIPKGKSLDGYTHKDITLLMNHINSIKRPRLDNRCPYELVSKDDKDMMWLMELMGMDTIPADDVHLNQRLLTR